MVSYLASSMGERITFGSYFHSSSTLLLYSMLLLISNQSKKDEMTVPATVTGTTAEDEKK
ncbi:hypothetical protein Pint_33612 [Pistacia integerrima]|uniref:Uncharacterized protein n=1 Tax=Pistacia integerrima TaxID=434235 RepID=A0ACC0X6S8_9ROSI|nr:hypothetical protein Pint_33612 [Pistacia integerrima]